MADRGAVVAYDAQAIEQGVYEHVMEPTAGFGATVVALDAEQTPVELADYGHPFDGPTGATDFTSEFTYDRTGTGYYMQPADDTQDQLNALSNGRSQVAGKLDLDMPFVASAVASSSPAARLDLDFKFSGSIAGTSTVPEPFLPFLKAIEGSAAGSAFVRSPILGLLGGYRDAVLASAPKVFLHLDEPTGTNLLNDTALGGAVVGSMSGSATRSNQTLVETALASGKLRIGLDNGTAGSARVVSQAAAPATLEWSLEFWYRSATTFNPTTIFVARNAQSFYILRVLNTSSGGMLRVQRSGSDASSTGPGSIDTIGFKNIHTDQLPHHVVVTYAPFEGNGTLRIFVDGELDVTTEAATPRATDTFDPTWTELPNFQKSSSIYPFEIDEVSYYDRAIVASEVASHYRAAFFALRLAGTPAGQAIVDPPTLTFAGGDLEALEGAAAGSSLVYGDVITGAGRALVGAVAGSTVVDPAMILRYGPLLVAESATINRPRKHAVFSRAKV